MLQDLHQLLLLLFHRFRVHSWTLKIIWGVNGRCAMHSIQNGFRKGRHKQGVKFSIVFLLCLFLFFARVPVATAVAKMQNVSTRGFWLWQMVWYHQTMLIWVWESHHSLSSVRCNKWKLWGQSSMESVLSLYWAMCPLHGQRQHSDAAWDGVHRVGTHLSHGVTPTT